MAMTKRKKMTLPRAPRVGRTPDILRKGGAMRDKTKYTRKNQRREINASHEN